MDELSVVIVTHNSAAVLPACLSAAFACANDVIVVDNASADATVAAARAFPDANVIANSENLGFAGGVNQGVRHSRHENILVLNPDTVLRNHPRPLITACRTLGYGAATGMLLGLDGLPQRGFNFRRLPSPWSLAFEVLGINRSAPWNPVNRGWRATDADPFAPQDVGQPAGAFLVFRKEVWEALGGFDTRFHPVWFEDVDFCRRLDLGGWRIRYVPEVQAWHAGGASIGSMEISDREVQWYVNLLKYSATAFGTAGRLGVALAVAVSAVLRWCWSAIHPSRRSRAKAYPKVFLGALRSMGEAVVGVGVKGTAQVPPWSGSRPVKPHPEATDSQANAQ
jgi:GT2 family glycosyltransferase